MRQLVQSNQFKRDYKKIAASGRHSVDDFLCIVELLSQDKPLPPKNRDHALAGEWKGYRECHITPDWLLIYQKHDKSSKSLVLVRTGSHSELF